MFNVCPNCGEYRPDKTIVSDGAYAVCPVCQYHHKFLRLPLFVLAGASGTGKSTICLALTARAKDYIVIESDILWDEKFNTPEDNYREFRETWLRLCKNISQAGKPVLLNSAGEPGHFEQCVERRYFSTIHYLALVCDDETLTSRLQSRPAWRKFPNAESIEPQLIYNRWLKRDGQNTLPPMTLIDTSKLTIDESVDEVERWVKSRLS
jgi:broad-specificity NMP kinase